MFDDRERQYVEAARVGRLATADGTGRPHAVPVCFALVDADLVTPVDEKPQEGSPETMRRVRDVDENPRVAVLVDHYTEDWSRLGWVQIRGTATVLAPDDADHPRAAAALRGKYDQYLDHALEDRPIIRIVPGSVLSWGRLERPGDTDG